jgi:ubiquitin carboxyl-terminal hydrolase 5/13
MPFALNVRRRVCPRQKCVHAPSSLPPPSFYLTIERTDSRKMQVDVNAEHPAKMTKLAIIEEREENKYEHVPALRHYRNGAAAATALDSFATISVPAEGIALVDGVMQSLFVCAL